MEPFHPTVFLPTMGRGCPPPRRQDRTDPENLSIPPHSGFRQGPSGGRSPRHQGPGTCRHNSAQARVGQAPASTQVSGSIWLPLERAPDQESGDLGSAPALSSPSTQPVPVLPNFPPSVTHLHDCC